jgi:hypothetical protein
MALFHSPAVLLVALLGITNAFMSHARFLRRKAGMPISPDQSMLNITAFVDKSRQVASCDATTKVRNE